MTFGFGFCSDRFFTGIGSGSVQVLAYFLLSGLDAVRFLAKPGFWFSSFLLGSCYFPSLTVMLMSMLISYFI